VQTGEQLVSLPGYKSEIVLKGKVSLLLWGSMPELYQHAPVFLLESAVTLHHQPALDLDLTLHRGRIYLTNRKEKGAALVRVRFHREEVWDITLEDADTTIGVEYMSIPSGRIPKDEEALAVFGFYILKGNASLKVGRRTYDDLQGPTGRALFVWSNKGGMKGPEDVQQKFVEWDRDQTAPTEPRDREAARQINKALPELVGALSDPTKRDLSALTAWAEDTDGVRQMLGIRGLVAIDSVPLLLDMLGRENFKQEEARKEALVGLRYWLGRSKEQASRLYDPTGMTGLLKDRKYSAIESQIILELLRGYPAEERRLKSTYQDLIGYLSHDKLLIRDLAHRSLIFLAPDQKIDYNPLAARDARARATDAWMKLLDTGKLPPPKPPKRPDIDD
jgi:hypothetical protein